MRMVERRCHIRFGNLKLVQFFLCINVPIITNGEIQYTKRSGFTNAWQFCYAKTYPSKICNTLSFTMLHYCTGYQNAFHSGTLNWRIRNQTFFARFLALKVESGMRSDSLSIDRSVCSFDMSPDVYFVSWSRY